MTNTTDLTGYEGNPNYEAFLAEEEPPYRRGLSEVRPEIVPQFMDQDERTAAIEAHLDIVQRETSMLRIGGVWIDEEEALQDGAEGLCDAARRYETNSAAAFSTYAVYRVRGAIVDGIRGYDKLAGPNRNKARVISQLNNTRAVSIFKAVGVLGHGDVLTVEDVTPADQPSTEELVEGLDETARLYAAINDLGPRQREVILLKLQGLSRQETADLIGVSLRAVKSDIEQAYAHLRSALSDVHIPSGD